jgi:hypothetical protein
MTISDDEMAKDDPDVCHHGWFSMPSDPCPECEDGRRAPHPFVAHLEGKRQEYRRQRRFRWGLLAFWVLALLACVGVWWLAVAAVTAWVSPWL